MKSTAQSIEEILKEQFSPLHLQVVDESALHAGHAGAASGGGHYRVTIVSKRFEGRPPLARHRMVNEALGGLLREAIHALALSTHTPGEWES